MRSSRRIGLAAAACIAWCASPPVSLAAEKFHSNPRAGIDYYLQSHGRVDPTRVPDTYQVFANVLRVADRSSTTVPQLVVVNDREQASAFVLADGTIYVSQKALDIIRANADETEATARLAFVLGH